MIQEVKSFFEETPSCSLRKHFSGWRRLTINANIYIFIKIPPIWTKGRIDNTILIILSTTNSQFKNYVSDGTHCTFVTPICLPCLSFLRLKLGVLYPFVYSCLSSWVELPATKAWGIIPLCYPCLSSWDKRPATKAWGIYTLCVFLSVFLVWNSCN